MGHRKSKGNETALVLVFNDGDLAWAITVLMKY
jgi:hypothetical protein